MEFDYSKIRNEAQTHSLSELFYQLELEIHRIGQGKSDNAKKFVSQVGTKCGRESKQWFKSNLLEKPPLRNPIICLELNDSRLPA